MFKKANASRRSTHEGACWSLAVCFDNSNKGTGNFGVDSRHEVGCDFVFGNQTKTAAKSVALLKTNGVLQCPYTRID